MKKREYLIQDIKNSGFAKSTERDLLKLVEEADEYRIGILYEYIKEFNRRYGGIVNG